MDWTASRASGPGGRAAGGAATWFTLLDRRAHTGLRTELSASEDAGARGAGLNSGRTIRLCSTRPDVAWGLPPYYRCVFRRLPTLEVNLDREQLSSDMNDHRYG